MTEHYQDCAFEVSEAAGTRLVGAFFYAEDGEHPEKTLVNLEPLGWRAFYLSAFLGFWSPVTTDDLAQIRLDYDGIPIVDIGEKLGVVGARLLRVTCSRTDGAGTSINLQFDRGLLQFSEADPHDPHSNTILNWESSERS